MHETEESKITARILAERLGQRKSFITKAKRLREKMRREGREETSKEGGQVGMKEGRKEEVTKKKERRNQRKEERGKKENIVHLTGMLSGHAK